MLFQDLACAALCFSQKVRLPDLVEMSWQWAFHGIMSGCGCSTLHVLVTCAQCSNIFKGN